MKGILGRKLGMTQIFDPESGAVTAVTVIEAGPCPVVHVRSDAADGYTPIFGIAGPGWIIRDSLGTASAWPHLAYQMER